MLQRSYGQHCLVLLDHYQAYMGYSTDLWAREVLKEEGPNQIYIGFSPASRSIFTSENVYHYFRYRLVNFSVGSSLTEAPKCYAIMLIVS